MKIGLTGGISSGKSTVSNYLKEFGATVIDADQIAHKLMEAEKELWQRIVEEFGEEILLDNKEINRQKLGKIIFNDHQAKELLDEISHPIIITKIKEEMDRLANITDIIIVDVPLLIEADMLDLFDQICLVYVDREVQIKRLMKRDEIDKESAVAKIQSQIPLKEKRRYADIIINNNGSKDKLKIKVKKLWEDLKED
ncbi:dephospho-CoA kinase [Orenia marismortui]|uniref:Dephospho-CoA kinase n=1 Tax=Orenia marismortui TaxID=46469 RepID=A0A4R8HFY6_9FIRM|nr:dephospho-CoA kinase [Orenia marismortui]TDX59035.1 dephospho-CoA kinase [Orenia marismortui]